MTWREKGVSIRQETRFSEAAATRLLIHTKSPAAFTLNVRIPYWADSATIAINGQPFQPKQKLAASTYAKIQRTWKDGDQIEVSLPMRLHLQPLPDDQNVAAIMYGPLVLAGELGTQDLNPQHIYSDDKYLHAGFPTIAVPELAANPITLDQWVQPLNSKAKPLTFRTVGAGHPQDITLSPFYRLFDQRYNIYWRFRPAADA